jgi:hypothetical protein
MFLNGAAAPHFRNIFISFERAAASLVKRYNNCTQRCSRSSGKENVNFM